MHAIDISAVLDGRQLLVSALRQFPRGQGATPGLLELPFLADDVVPLYDDAGQAYDTEGELERTESLQRVTASSAAAPARRTSVSL